jgi:TldD protein
MQKAHSKKIKLPEMTRRDFLELSAKGMAVAAIPAFLNKEAPLAHALSQKEDTQLADYFSRFGVDEALIKKIIATALENGGDYCDLFFQHSITNYVGLEDKSVNRAYSNVDFGVGIRVLKGDQTGYSFTEDLSPEAMRLAAKTASNIASGSKKMLETELKVQKIPDYYPIVTSWEDVKIERKIPYLQKINDKIFSLDNRVIKSSIWFTDESAYILIATSDGQVAYDYQPMTSISVTCTAEEKGKKEQNYYSVNGRQGIELFTPANVERLATEPVRRTVELFEAVKPEGGEMEVVLAPGASGILLHEAIGHGMEADFNRKEVSIFSDKINKPVAKDIVSIIDDGTIPHARGSINIDDEASPSQKTYLVEKGILKSYIHDRISAKYYKLKSTGNGRRESFRYMPLPRMRCTYMTPGPHKRDEIIKSVKKGLYAESFTNGEVFIGAGDFTFYVKSGRIIENGKMTKPVKDINIIGNGPEVLSKITMVADDFKMDEGGWTCGKNGQGVPVSMGLPTVKVSSITVGGVK